MGINIFKCVHFQIVDIFILSLLQHSHANTRVELVSSEHTVTISIIDVNALCSLSFSFVMFNTGIKPRSVGVQILVYPMENGMSV